VVVTCSNYAARASVSKSRWEYHHNQSCADVTALKWRLASCSFQKLEAIVETQGKLVRSRTNRTVSARALNFGATEP